MTLSPGLRKAALTARVAAAVGWLGAVAAFLTLAVVGLTSRDAQTVRGAHLVTGPAAKIVLLLLAFSSMVTGPIQALGTPSELVRHY